MSGSSEVLSNTNSYGNACYFVSMPVNCTTVALLINHNK